MALPAEFSTPRVDEQGRTYVIHQPTGVRYLVRERDHPKGHVTSYTRQSSVVEYHKPKSHKPKSKPREADHFARATFIEGSQP